MTLSGLFKLTLLLGILFLFFKSLPRNDRPEAGTVWKDRDFLQEYHEPYPVFPDGKPVGVRSITVDGAGQVWIATEAGVYRKKTGETAFLPVLPEADRGPAFSVTTDRRGTVWMSAWNGIYRAEGNTVVPQTGPPSPIAVLAPAPEGLYALGPHGLWLLGPGGWQKKTDTLARSVRAAVAGPKGSFWIASDVGLYEIGKAVTRRIVAPTELPSAYVKGVAFDTEGNLWAGALGGVSILKEGKTVRFLRPKDGLPSAEVTTVERAPDSTMWVGTKGGVVRFRPDGSRSLRFSRRWLLDDQVNDIAFDRDGTAWIATPQGVSAIRRRPMTLARKQDYFYDVLMKRHIRTPWIAGQCRLRTPGDLSTWEPDDDDNDGEYTGNYLAMEALRYAVTKSPDAKEKAAKAFRFLKLLQEVTGTDGFFARTIVPADWKTVDDANRTYTTRELADELVKEPRFKPVEVRWRKSADGKWLWKGDTSSDELCGHMFGYYFYYELVADEAEKTVIRQHVARILDYLMKHDYNLVDIDGKPTRWAVWSPGRLNRDPEWAPDRSQNSMELLAFLKLGYYMTCQEKYQKEYLRLIEKEHYLENMDRIPEQNPAWFIYFDVMLQSYVYPILIRCEEDLTLRKRYIKHMDDWMERRKGDRNPQINFLYGYATGKKVELASSIEFLVDTPLDLINWTVDHTKREDIRIVRSPVLDEWQTSELPPASIRTVVRWDKNPWAAVNGNPDIEREPVFWLFPYWLGRYMGMIE
ncbi:ligand-binding sensor domain-containing protein [Larkinella soli]|uniref:ligand-binding sensor domain-containing protein n=1 Tax=Larkinella soli TaxID=1770527 RepID=UPI000FFC76A8|nr:regulator [Larkinella soli]